MFTRSQQISDIKNNNLRLQYKSGTDHAAHQPQLSSPSECVQSERPGPRTHPQPRRVCARSQRPLAHPRHHAPRLQSARHEAPLDRPPLGRWCSRDGAAHLHRDRRNGGQRPIRCRWRHGAGGCYRAEYSEPLDGFGQLGRSGRFDGPNPPRRGHRYIHGVRRRRGDRFQ